MYWKQTVKTISSPTCVVQKMAEPSFAPLQGSWIDIYWLMKQHYTVNSWMDHMRCTDIQWKREFQDGWCIYGPYQCLINHANLTSVDSGYSEFSHILYGVIASRYLTLGQFLGGKSDVMGIDCGYTEDLSEAHWLLFMMNRVWRKMVIFAL